MYSICGNFYGAFPFFVSSCFISLPKTTANTIEAVIIEIASETGSARNTASTLFSKKQGKMYMRGISKITFLKQAIKSDAFALPIAIKVC